MLGCLHLSLLVGDLRRQPSVWLNETILNSGVGIHESTKYLTWLNETILNSGVGIHETTYISKLFVLYKILLFSKCLKISFLEKQCFSIHYVEFFYYIQELRFVSGNDLCLGPNTVSFSVCQSDCIGELIKINSQKGKREKTIYRPSLKC